MTNSICNKNKFELLANNAKHAEKSLKLLSREGKGARNPKQHEREEGTPTKEETPTTSNSIKRKEGTPIQSTNITHQSNQNRIKPPKPPNP